MKCQRHGWHQKKATNFGDRIYEKTETAFIQLLQYWLKSNCLPIYGGEEHQHFDSWNSELSPPLIISNHLFFCVVEYNKVKNETYEFKKPTFWFCRVWNSLFKEKMEINPFENPDFCGSYAMSMNKSSKQNLVPLISSILCVKTRRFRIFNFDSYKLQFTFKVSWGSIVTCARCVWLTKGHLTPSLLN